MIIWLIKKKQVSYQAGVTLIELLISLSMLAIVAVGLSIFITASLRMNADSRDASIASNLLQHQLETYLSDFTKVPASTITLKPGDIDSSFANQPVNQRMLVVVEPGDTAQDPMRVELRAYSVNPPGSTSKKALLFQLSSLISKQKRFGHHAAEQ